MSHDFEVKLPKVFFFSVMPAPDPKSELNITSFLTSFLTLPHPLHCPICAEDIMVTVLLLQVMGGWDGLGVVHLC